MIALIDYDAGNIMSASKAFEFLGEKVVITRDPKIILNAQKVVLPGVGAFGDSMANLHSFGLDEVIREVIDRKTPFLGICLGLQLLFEESEEAPGIKGLGILPGRIARFKPDMGLNVPQIGWNSLKFPRKSRLFEGIREDSYVYLVHSYYLQSTQPEDVIATCEYGVTFDAAVERDNVFACQFHPEKSSDVGLRILKNFVEI